MLAGCGANETSRGSRAARPTGVLPAGTTLAVQLQLETPGTPGAERWSRARRTVGRIPALRTRGLESLRADAALQLLLDRVAHPSVNFERDIRPWAGPTAGVGTWRGPDGRSVGVVWISTRSQRRATEAAERLLGGRAERSYRGVAVREGALGPRRVAWALVERRLVVGSDRHAVTAAIDASRGYPLESRDAWRDLVRPRAQQRHSLLGVVVVRGPDGADQLAVALDGTALAAAGVGLRRVERRIAPAGMALQVGAGSRGPWMDAVARDIPAWAPSDPGVARAGLLAGPAESDARVASTPLKLRVGTLRSMASVVGIDLPPNLADRRAADVAIDGPLQVSADRAPGRRTPTRVVIDRVSGHDPSLLGDAVRSACGRAGRCSVTVARPGDAPGLDLGSVPGVRDALDAADVPESADAIAWLRLTSALVVEPVAARMGLGELERDVLRGQLARVQGPVAWVESEASEGVFSARLAIEVPIDT